MIKRKLFFMGKVYDMASTPIADIEKDIEARVQDYTKVFIPVKIKNVSDNEVEVMLYRGVNEEMQTGWILDQDKWLITGEGYNKFMPQYGGGGFYYAGLNANYYSDMNDFIADYKRNAVYYGGKRSRVKNAVIDEQQNFLKLNVKYG